MSTVNIHAVVQTEILEASYAWLCIQRNKAHHNNSVWDFRFKKDQYLPALQQSLLDGTYRFSPLKSHTINGNRLSSWNAADLLVLKAISLALQPLITQTHAPHSAHLKNAGGVHGALQQVVAHQSHYQQILKTDVKDYYASINHDILLSLCRTYIDCEILLNLIRQYCERLEIRDGHYFHFAQGIPKGCPLSPLMGTLYLKPLDDALSRKGFYIRFMDDWIVMVKTKHQLRKIIKLTHKILEKLKLKMHPDKTFFGCIKKGFDFLGIHFGEQPEISKTSLEKHRERIDRRYAQGASAACIGSYIERWTSWCKGMLACCEGVSRLGCSIESSNNHRGNPLIYGDIKNAQYNTRQDKTREMYAGRANVTLASSTPRDLYGTSTKRRSQDQTQLGRIMQ